MKTIIFDPKNLSIITGYPNFTENIIVSGVQLQKTWEHAKKSQAESQPADAGRFSRV